MWCALLGIVLLFLLAGIYERMHPLPERSGEAVICGRLVKKEVKNDKLILYLKGVSICSGFESDSDPNAGSNFNSKNNSKNEATKKTENGKWERLVFQGFVCYADTEAESASSGKRGMVYEDGYVIGRKVTLAGDVSLINAATNPGEFDARKYYRARGYRHVLYNAKPYGERKKSSGEDIKKSPTLPEMLYRFRRVCSTRLNEYLGENYGGILSAMLFGEKENLSEDVKDMYRDGGISHILAISGLHISLIGAFLYAALTFFPLPKKASFALTVVILLLYGLMVGFAPSVFRAIFMFSYRLLARNLKKAYDPPTALAFSAFLTCLVFPFMVQDSSFLLTYLAFVGIVFLYPNLISAKPGKKKWVEGFYVSFAVFAVTLPIILRDFASVSFGGFLLNMLVIPAMPVLFACAFILVILSFFFQRGAVLFALLTKSILFAMESAVRTMNRFSFVHVSVKAPGLGRMVIYTTLVVVITVASLAIKRKVKLKYYECLNEIVRLRDRGVRSNQPGQAREKNTGARLGKVKETAHEVRDEEDVRTELLGIKAADIARRVLFFVLISCCMVFLMTTPKKAVVTFLDVGQGDGFFIRTDDGKVYMIDGGSTSKKNIGDKIIVPYLQYEGEKAVDLWFLTHEDADHINGFEQVLKDGEVTIRAIALPIVCKEDETEFWKVKHLAKERGIPILYLKEGDVISSSQGYLFRVISPSPYQRYDDRNDSSLVLLYERQGRLCREEFFLMGDSTTQGEDAVERYLKKTEAYISEKEYGKAEKEYGSESEKEPVTFTILKCAHHGSANDSNSEDFIRMLDPDYAIISCGRNNVYGHPHKETMESLDAVGSSVYRTDRQGCLMIHVSGRRVRVTPYCK